MNGGKILTIKKQLKAICLGVLIISLMAATTTVFAATETANGGEVTSKSKITFIEGDKPKPAPKPAPNTPPKKGGVLPQTGESVSQFLWIGIVVIVLVTSLFFWKKKRKENDHEN